MHQTIKIPKAVLTERFCLVLDQRADFCLHNCDQGNEHQQHLAERKALTRATALVELSAFDPVMVFVDSRWGRWLTDGPQ